MKKLVTLSVSAAFLLGATVPMSMLARAEVQVPNATSFHTALIHSSPLVTEVSCKGTTGIHGCGPGWTWHYGWKGWACYTC